VAAIGGSAAARVVASKLHPVKVTQPEPILDILDKLQATLQGTPPPWLRKALLKGQPRTFDFDDEEVQNEHGRDPGRRRRRPERPCCRTTTSCAS
jgi:nitrogen fixation protein NifX